ncbi:MAG: SIMPL domain-containing protein [Chloroflexota bacterium]
MSPAPSTTRRGAMMIPAAAFAAVSGMGIGMGMGPAAFAQEATPEGGARQPGMIGVSGQGIVNVPPDTATVTVGIDVIRPDLAEAQAEASKQATDIINAVKAEGVEARDIQTANYNVSVVRNYAEGADPTQITGFEVMNQVMITIREIGGAGKLMAAVVEAGANSIYGVSFFVDDPKPFEAEARKLAVEDARAKAEQLAAASGSTLGRVVSISEDGGGFVPGPIYAKNAAMAAPEAAMDVPMESGTSAIQISVQMTFEIA